MKIRNDWKQTILHVLMSLIVVALIGAVLWKIKIPFISVDPSMQHWNDEVYYYQMVASTARYGHPQGYFGFNESHALIGGYGAWSPLIMYFYTPFYMLQGGSLLSVYRANLFLVVIAMFILFQWNHCSWKECFYYSVVVLCGQIIRYSYGGLAEPMYWFLSILIVSCIINRDHLKAYWLGVILITYASLSRIYLLIYLLPLMFADGIKKNKCIQFLVVVLLVIIGSTITNRYFLAAYFRPTIRFSELKEALEAGGLLSYISGNFRTVSVFIRNGIGYGERRAVLYTIFFATGLLLIVRSVIRAVHHQMNRMDHLMNLVYFGAFFLMINLYYAGETDRHFFSIALFTWILLIHEMIMSEKKPLIVLYLFLLFCATDLLFFRNSENRWLYQENNLYRLPQLSEIAPADGDPFDNTIAYECDIDFNSYRILYDVHPGMGINFCSSEYLRNPSIIQSRYVILAYESGALPAYQNSADWAEIMSNEKCIIFERK
ncbi:MAG: hypothetical protein VZT48_04300 [Bulleidia sp.]|nr:hypothetical protein [Bulleidia sp.]